MNLIQCLIPLSSLAGSQSMVLLTDRSTIGINDVRSIDHSMPKMSDHSFVLILKS